MHELNNGKRGDLELSLLPLLRGGLFHPTTNYSLLREYGNEGTLPRVHLQMLVRTHAGYCAVSNLTRP
jgi:hypothetical protein